MSDLSSIEKRGLAKLRSVKQTWKNLFIFLIIFFAIYLLFTVHNDMRKSENLITYFYAFFPTINVKFLHWGEKILHLPPQSKFASLE